MCTTSHDSTIVTIPTTLISDLLVGRRLVRLQERDRHADQADEARAEQEEVGERAAVVLASSRTRAVSLGRERPHVHPRADDAPRWPRRSHADEHGELPRQEQRSRRTARRRGVDHDRQSEPAPPECLRSSIDARRRHGRHRRAGVRAADGTARPPPSARRDGVTPSPYDPAVPLDVVIAPYGRAAAERLRDAVAAHKADDPLAPGHRRRPHQHGRRHRPPAARRRASSGRCRTAGSGSPASPSSPSTASPSCVGAARLAADGRRPVSTPVLAAAVRQVLARDPGMFASVAEHPATERALVEASRELAQCDDDALDGAAAHRPRARAEVVRVVGAARRLLAPAWFDERDLMDAAAAAIVERHRDRAHRPRRDRRVPPPGAAGSRGAPPARPSPRVAPVTVLAGATGVGACRRPGARRASTRSASPPTTRRGRSTVAHGTQVVSASGSRRRGARRRARDRRRAARRRAARAHGGALGRGRAVRAARARAARRRRDPAQRHRRPHARAERARQLAARPARAPRPRLPPPRPDGAARVGAGAPGRRARRRTRRAGSSISRRAGIVRGRRQWESALAREVAAREHDVAQERARTDRDPRPEWLERELAATRDLLAFVTGLADELDAGAAPGRSWRELAEWAQGLVDTSPRRTPAVARRGRSPSGRRPTRSKPRSSGSRGSTRWSPRRASTCSAARSRSSSTPTSGASGRLGDGVYVGPVSSGLGLDLDLVIVCGLVEGTFPGRVRDDSLLPDADRRATNGALALRSARVHDDHRRFLAALAARDAHDARVLTFPAATSAAPPSGCRRASCSTRSRRSTARARPPTTSLAAHRAVAHRRAVVHRRPRARRVPGHRARSTGCARCSTPPARGDAVASAPLRAVDLAFDRGLECTLAAAGRSFTRFDGNLSALAVPSPTDEGAIVSPTRLETWAASPFEYLMEQVLRVEIPELPEEVWELSPLDKGNLVHEILDTFLDEVLARPEGAPAPGAPWTDADRARLHELASLGRRGLRGPRPHRSASVLGPRPAAAARGARPLPPRGHRAPRAPGTAPGRHRAALRVRGRRPARGRDRAVRRPHAALPRRGRPRRPRASGGELSVVDYKTGRTVRGLEIAAAGVRARRARRVRRRRHPRHRRLLVREHARRLQARRGAARRRDGGAARRAAARRSSTASSAACSRASSTSRDRGRPPGAATPTPTSGARATAGASGCASATRPSSRRSGRCSSATDGPDR